SRCTISHGSRKPLRSEAKSTLQSLARSSCFPFPLLVRKVVASIGRLLQGGSARSIDFGFIAEK
ncbi:hypothetical protein LH612_34645, partial [Klebsiella pneumoniae]|nr:hypothetical protein [Klebsiella pneumoniae]